MRVLVTVRLGVCVRVGVKVRVSVPVRVAMLVGVRTVRLAVAEGVEGAVTVAVGVTPWKVRSKDSVPPLPLYAVTMNRYVVAAGATSDTFDCDRKGTSSLHPAAARLPHVPVYAERIVSYVLPEVSTVSVPAPGVVNRYHTLALRLPLPQVGIGSPVSVVASVVFCVLAETGSTMRTALPQASFEIFGVGVKVRAGLDVDVWVALRVATGVAGVACPNPRIGMTSAATLTSAPDTHFMSR